MEIISRARWGARYPRGFGPAPLPAAEVWLHHSVTLAPDLTWVDVDRDGVEDDEEKAMRLLEDIGQARFGGGISYTFAVMPSGRVYEGHGVDRQGAHTRGRNNIARAIVLVGDYSSRPPTNAQRHAVAALLQHGHRAKWWTTARLNGGHRDAPGAQTACPGNAAEAAIVDINRLALGGPITGEDDDMALDDTLPPVRLADGNMHTLTVGDVLWGLAQQIPGNGSGAGVLTPHPTGQFVSRILATDSIRAELAGLRAAVDKLAGAVGGDELTAEELREAVAAGVADALADTMVVADDE